MQLTEHFTLEELTVTRVKAPNEPGPVELGNLLRVAAVLEQVRALVGKPISVNSGYRSLGVNKAVGGSINSAHVKGLAADFTAPGITNKALALLIRESEIQFDQLIYEGNWVHIGLSEGKPRRQVMTAKFSPSGTTYVLGIE